MKIIKCWRIAIVIGKQAEIDKVKKLAAGTHHTQRYPGPRKKKERTEKEIMAGVKGSDVQALVDGMKDEPPPAKNAQPDTIGGSGDGFAGPTYACKDCTQFEPESKIPPEWVSKHCMETPCSGRKEDSHVSD